MITVEINDAELLAGLAALKAAMTDMTQPMGDIGEYAIMSTKRRFAEGKSPEGVPWAPKSLTTIETYRRQSGKGGNAAVPFRPLFGPSGSLSSQISHDPGPDSVAWGSPMVYAAAMQFGMAKGAAGTASNGTPIPWGNIPARPFLGLDERDEAAITAIILEWLEQAV